ncbi:MAG: NAD(P)-binding protein, partial [Bacteroidota bacterium]|nr:NAD(P)-binding protein [Bacteroidota bacterium]
MKKIAVIGAGISGISIANMLHPNFEVKVFEKADKIGGLIKCERVNDNLFHKVGGHVFNTKNQKVSDWFWSHFDLDNEFIKAKRNAKILLDRQYLDYPIENFLFQLSAQTVRSIIKDFLEINARDTSNFSNFEEFLKGNFGETLYNLYFKPYNNKLWNVDLSGVPLEWLDGKLPMPNIPQILHNNIIKKEESEMVHSSFYYAKEGGSQFIIDRLSEDLDIQTNFNLQKIQYKNGLLVLNETETFDYIIYTGDLR